MVSRRTFLATTAATLATPAMSDQSVARGGSRKKVAFLGTIVREHSHAQHFLDRLAGEVRITPAVDQFCRRTTRGEERDQGENKNHGEYLLFQHDVTIRCD